MYLQPVYLFNSHNNKKYYNVDDIGDDCFNPLKDGSKYLVCFESTINPYLYLNQHEENKI